MKRILIFAAAASMLFGVASCQKETASDKDDYATVVFSVEAPSLPQTKAFGDGTQDLKLLCAVYAHTFLGGRFEAEEGLLLDGGIAPQIVRGTTAEGNVKWEVTLSLVKKFKYDIVFWAQTVPAQGESPYTFVPDKAQIVATYDGDANDETRDAFYNVCTGYELTKTGVSIALRRPFAQINLGASDYDALTDLSITDLTSAVTTTTATVPNTLNLLDGTVEGAARIEFVKSAAPAGTEDAKNNIVVGTGTQARTYRLVGMNYILADTKDKNATVNLNMNFSYNGADLDIEVPNVPYARNYRTNIVGGFFTENNKFDIVIVPEFEDEDIIINN
jgi:hypothetical protein